MSDERFSKLDALDRLRADRTLQKHQKLVLAMLISHANSEGSCFPGYETLAAECALSRSSVADALRSLEALGSESPVAVTVARRGRSDADAGGRAPNMYQLSLPGTLKPVVESAPRTQGGGLSPKRGGVESKKRGGLSPAGGLEAGSEAGSEAGKRSVSAQPQPEPPDPNVRELWDHYHAEHQRLRRVKPVFTPQQRGAVGKAWKAMLSVLSLAEAKSVVSRALAKGFHLAPTAILKNLNSYRGEDPVRTFGKPEKPPGLVEHERIEAEEQRAARRRALEFSRT